MPINVVRDKVSRIGTERSKNSDCSNRLWSSLDMHVYAGQSGPLIFALAGFINDQGQSHQIYPDCANAIKLSGVSTAESDSGCRPPRYFLDRS